MYDKVIDPAYETIGKRRRLTGYIGEIRDGAIVLHSAHYDNHHDAEGSLNAIVYDLLTDLAERGLVDTLPEPMLMPEGDYIDVEGMRVVAPRNYCANTEAPQIPLFDDVARVINMALGQSHGAASVVAELRRVKARLDAVAAEQEQTAERISSMYELPAMPIAADLPY